MDIEKTLQESFLFGEFPHEEIRRVAQICTTLKIPKGQTIFEEGEHGDALFLVQRGSIRIFRVLSETYRETLAMLGPGAVFGEMSFIDRVPRSSSAVAEEGSVLIQVSRSDFDVILSKQPSLASKVIKKIASVMATRIRATNDKISEAVRWVQEIHERSEWGLGELRAGKSQVEIAIQGRGKTTGKVVDVTQNPVGFAILWESEDGRMHWTPYHALYYLRVQA
jgi:CRP/FNR family cyclic AMP-dependent transcriptional regulator